jgi:hypothetical protein
LVKKTEGILGVNIGGMVMEDLQDCIQLGINYELPPHATHIGRLCKGEGPTGLDPSTPRLTETWLCWTCNEALGSNAVC